MKKTSISRYTLLLLLSVAAISSRAQGLIIKPGACFTVSGAAGIVIHNGSFVNNGNYFKGNETLMLSGNAPHVISGESNTQLNNLQVSNTGGITAKTDLLTTGNLTIAAASRLTIDTARSVAVTNTLNNLAGTAGIIIKANAMAVNGTLIFHNAESSPVQATVEMYSRANWTWVNGTRTNLRWQFFGIPVRSIGVSPTFNGSYVRKYNEAGTGSGLTTDKRWIQLQSTAVLTPIDGYQIVQESGKIYTIKGELVNKGFTRKLSYTEGAEFPGQHILANPYTAAIDIKNIEFGDSVEKVIYQYNTGSFEDWYNSAKVAGDSPGQYTSSTQNTAGDYGIPAQIPSMQGFLVRALKKSDHATLTIPYATSTSKNKERQRIQANTGEKVYTVIEAIGSRFSDRLWIYSNPECTRAFDNGWDGRKLLTSTPSPQIFAMEADGNYQINALDDISNTELGFKAGEDLIYTLRFKHMNMADTYPRLYLVDLADNNVTDISQDNSEYTFSAPQTTDPVKRFRIVTNPGITTGTKLSEGSRLHIFNRGNSVFIDNKSATPGKLCIFDVTGHAVLETSFRQDTLTTVNTNLTPGTYILKTLIGGNEQVLKILISP